MRAIVFVPPPPTPTILMFVRILPSISSSSASTRESSVTVPAALWAMASSSIDFIGSTLRVKLAGHPIPRSQCGIRMSVFKSCQTFVCRLDNRRGRRVKRGTRRGAHRSRPDETKFGRPVPRSPSPEGATLLPLARASEPAPSPPDVPPVCEHRRDRRDENRNPRREQDRRGRSGLHGDLDRCRAVNSLGVPNRETHRVVPRHRIAMLCALRRRPRRVPHAIVFPVPPDLQGHGEVVIICGGGGVDSEESPHLTFTG